MGLRSYLLNRDNTYEGLLSKTVAVAFIIISDEFLLLTMWWSGFCCILFMNKTAANQYSNMFISFPSSSFSFTFVSCPFL